MIQIRSICQQMLRRIIPAADAGQDLRLAVQQGTAVIHGADPETCQVELVHPVLPYETKDGAAPCITIDAWLAAWRVTQFPNRDRDMAIIQDLTRVRAGILALAELALQYDDEETQEIRQRFQFDEEVVVAHHWFLLTKEHTGDTHFRTLQLQVRQEDVRIEAQLLMVSQTGGHS